MVVRKWRVRLGAAAQIVFANILKWTTEDFGAHQSRPYRDTLVQAIGELGNGPDVAGTLRLKCRAIPTSSVARNGLTVALG